MRGRLTGSLLLLVLLGCDQDPVSGRWTIRFACDALADATVQVRAHILEDGCERDATERYAEILPEVGPGPAPPELPPGTYGFRVEALDGSGGLLGEACETATLPGAPAVEVTLVDVEDGRFCARDDGGAGDGSPDDDGGTEPPGEPNCEDNLRNGDETDRDCGGPDCAPCNDFLTCAVNADCKSLVCEATQCRTATCDDRVKSGTETDVDCGGLFCPPCGVGADCLVPTDCENLGCEDGVCLGPACDDELRNGDESDVDCGGICDPCPLKAGCAKASDCDSGACDEGVCVVGQCLNEALDSGESDIDCGGLSCAACVPGQRCNGPGDCITGICTGGECQPFTQFGYSPANFDPTGLEPTAAAAITVLDCGATVFDTDTLELTNWCEEALPIPVIRTQSAGPELVVIPLRGLRIATGSLLRLEGGRGAVLAVHGDAEIDGVVDVRAVGAFSGPGGGVDCGGGTGGAGGEALTFSRTGGGGGGAFRTDGGHGGDAANSRGGSGGDDFGGSDLEPLRGGCRGGRAGGCPGQLGGAGGGAFQISASRSLSVNGEIDARGGAGSTCIGNQTGGAGGGSGGSILLEGVSVSAPGPLRVDGGRGADGVLGGLGGPGGTPTELPGNGGSTDGSLLSGGGGGGGGSSGRTRIVEHPE